jgi:preprotein translocase subunit SecD
VPEISVIVVLVFCLIMYFLPGIVASRRKKQNSGAILALNFFLGWTLTVDNAPAQAGA